MRLAGTFLELAVGGTARKVAFGSGSVGWGTGNDFSQLATISHGLGVTPPGDVGVPFLGDSSGARTAGGLVESRPSPSRWLDADSGLTRGL